MGPWPEKVANIKTNLSNTHPSYLVDPSLLQVDLKLFGRQPADDSVFHDGNPKIPCYPLLISYRYGGLTYNHGYQK